MVHSSEQVAASVAAGPLCAETRYQALFMATERAGCIIEQVPAAPGQPSDYRYVAVNPAFTRHSGLPDVVGQTLRQVVPGVEARIVALFDDALASGQPRYYEEYVADLGMWIAGEVLPDPQPGHLAVLFSNVTARYQAEQTLHENTTRQAYLLALSDALQSVPDAAAVQATVTHTALHYFGADRCYYGEVDGDTVTIRHDAATPGLPSVAAVYSLSAMPIFSEVLRQGQPVVVTDAATSPALDENLRQLCLDSHLLAYISVPVVRYGERAGIFCLTQDTARTWTALEVALVQETAERTWVAVEQARAQEALRRSEAQFRLLVTATSDVVYRMSPDWSQMHQLLGKNFLADTVKKTGRWLEHYIPVADQEPVQAAIEAARATKTLFELEHRVFQADGRVGWVYSRALPVLDAQGNIVEWLGAAQDVTARKQAEAQLRDFNAVLERQVAGRTRELRESRDLLHAIAETQTTHVSAFQAVRDEQGRLVDLEFLFANSATTRLVGGRALVGQRYLALFPQMVELGLWEFFSRVVETGETLEREQVNEAGPVGWFHVIASRLGDGLLVCSQDITARKQAEQERARLLRLLEQAEEVASIGSWDYEPATGRLLWSAGMYRLFGMTPADPVGPERYRQVAVPDDLPIAERLLHHLTAGTDAFEETLRLQIGEQVKTVRVRGVVLAGEPGQARRVLGVDLDISDVRRLEAENLTLRLDQQKALLLAILQAQEAERARLAETLHNGLGQVLYAIKLQLSQLDVPALRTLPELNSVRHHANHLLSEAISQARTLAHELMPATLSERGLGHALRDICRAMSTPRLRFSCQVWLDEQALPPALQTTLYRLAQELAHNIAKHSGASQATIEFERLPGWVSLRAEDNGRGFDSATTPWGLGLRLLHDAVELLGGTMQLDSSPKYGTHIRLRIPLA